MKRQDDIIFFVVGVLLPFISLQSVSSSSECEYTGDIRDISIENCLEREMEKCHKIFYGPGPLLDTRGNQTFWIGIEEKGLARYQIGSYNITYTILRSLSGESGKNLSQILDCRSLELNETCVLPKKETKSEIQYVYLPIVNNSDIVYNRYNVLYCYFELEERAKFFEYCKNDEEMYCLELRKGKFYRRDVFVPLSLENYRRFDFCFFRAPNKYVVANGTETPNFHQPNITRIGSGNNISAKFGDDVTKCSIVENAPSESYEELAAQYHDSKISDFVCFFTRQGEISLEFTSRAKCLKLLRRDEGISTAVIVVVAVTCSLIVLLLIVIAVNWLYRKHLIQYTFKKNIQDLPDTLADDNGKAKVFAYSTNDGRENHFHSTTEVPEAITLENVKQDKTCKREEKDNKPEETNSLDSKRQSKTEYRISETDRKLDAPVTSSSQDSGVSFDKKDLEEEQPQDKRVDSEIETDQVDSGLGLTSPLPDNQPCFDTDNPKVCVVASDGYTAKHSSIPLDDVNDTFVYEDPTDKKDSCNRNSPAHCDIDEDNAISMIKSIPSPSESNFSSNYIMKTPCATDVLSGGVHAVDGYIAKG